VEPQAQRHHAHPASQRAAAGVLGDLGRRANKQPNARLLHDLVSLAGVESEPAQRELDVAAKCTLERSDRARLTERARAREVEVVEMGRGLAGGEITRELPGIDMDVGPALPRLRVTVVVASHVLRPKARRVPPPDVGIRNAGGTSTCHLTSPVWRLSSGR